MSKIAFYLQEHLSGEVVESTLAREYFSTDGSVLSIKPLVITYPADERDVRKTARFSWQLAERGRDLPITPRGNGTDLNGGAIGNGVIMVFPAHLNKIIRFDPKNALVVVEPGLNFAKLNQVLRTHGYFLPFEPYSSEYSTIGGAVANNKGGRYSLKYKDASTYVEGLRVVLANGDVIDTCPIGHKELNKKMGQINLEGEIYRAVDAIIEEHQDLSELSKSISSKSSGYNLDKVKTKKGFDLTPLFLGSQGTLGIITQITLKIEPLKMEQESYLMAYLENNQDLGDLVQSLKNMSNPPSFIEFIDRSTLELVDKISPNSTSGWITKPYPKALLVIGYSEKEKEARKGLSKATKLLSKLASRVELINQDDEINVVHKLDSLNLIVLNHFENDLYPTSVLSDLVVPSSNIAELLHRIDELARRSHLDSAMWGRIGEGIVHFQPIMDLNQTGDRQMFFKFLNEGSKLVNQLGGSMNADGGEGRLKVPYMENEFSKPMLDTFRKIKYVFDPMNILNPGVKFDTNEDDIKNMLKAKHNPRHLEHLPRY